MVNTQYNYLTKDFTTNGKRERTIVLNHFVGDAVTYTVEVADLPLTGASASLEAYYKDSSIFDLPCVVDSVLSTITFFGELTQAELIGYFEDTAKDYQYFCANIDILIGGVHTYIPITFFVRNVIISTPTVDMATQAELDTLQDTLEAEIAGIDLSPITSAIDDEETARIGGDNDLSEALGNHTGDTSNPHEVTYSQVGADVAGAASTVAGNLSSEITDRENADSALNSDFQKNSRKASYVTNTLGNYSFSIANLLLSGTNPMYIQTKAFSATADNYVQFATPLNSDYSKLRLYYKWALADYVTDTYNHPTQANGRITDFAFSGADLVFISGLFTTIGGVNRSYLACWNKSTNALTDFAPVINGAINCLIVIGDLLYIFGAFTTCDSVARSKCAAYNITTGVLDSVLNPSSINGTINSARYANNKIYIGGAFTNVNGFARSYVAAFYTNGSLDGTFNPVVVANASGVTQIEVNATLSIVYIGGMGITSIGGVAKSLGAVNWDTGALYTTFATVVAYGTLYGMRFNANSPNLWICGNFNAKHGSVNASTGAVLFTAALSNSYGLANLPVTNAVILYGRHTGYNCLIKSQSSYFSQIPWAPVPGGDLGQGETSPHGLEQDPITGYIWAGSTQGVIAVARDTAFHKIVSGSGNLVTTLSLMPFDGDEALSNAWTTPIKQTLTPQSPGIINTSYIEIDKPDNLDYAYLKWSRLAVSDVDDTNALGLQIFDTWIEEIN